MRASDQIRDIKMQLLLRENKGDNYIMLNTFSKLHGVLEEFAAVHEIFTFFKIYLYRLRMLF
jgi:hypothetical protein